MNPLGESHSQSPKIRGGICDQHVVLTNKLRGAMLPSLFVIQLQQPSQDLTHNEKRIKPFTIKVGQRHVAKMSESFPSKLVVRFLPYSLEFSHNNNITSLSC